MAQWTLQLFDGFALHKDDQLVASFGSRKESVMLACLALQPERALTRDEICEAVWPGRELQRARRNFSYTCSVLRKQLAEHGKADTLYVGARSVQLNPNVFTDRARFEELLATALRGGGEDRRGMLEQALVLHGTGLLPGFDMPWIDAERKRLARLAAAARRSLVELSAGEGALAGALGDLRGSAFAGGADERGGGDHGASAQTPAAPTRRRRRKKPDDRPEAVLAWAEAMADPLNGPDRMTALDAVSARWPAVEAALAHFRTRREHRMGGRLVAALWRYWVHRTRAEDGHLHAEAFLAFGDWPPGRHRARLLHAAGTLAHKTGDNVMAYRRLRSAVTAWADVDDDAGLLSSLANLAMVAYALDGGEETDAEAASRYEEALRIASHLGTDYHRTTLLLGAAQLSIRRGERDRALELLESRRVVVERTGDRPAEASTWSHVASARLLEPVDLDGAVQAVERARVLYAEVGDVQGECFAMRLMGYAAEKRAEKVGAKRGEAADSLAEAERWYRAALALAKETHDAWSVEEGRKALDALIARLEHEVEGPAEGSVL